MHFEISKCKSFLEDAPLPHTKFIYFWPKKDLKFGIFSSLNRRIFLRKQSPKMNIGPKIMHSTSPKTNFSYTRGRCLRPLSRAFPLDPIRDAIGGPGPHSWVLALRTWCFSLQAIPKSWKPCLILITRYFISYISAAPLNVYALFANCKNDL